MANILCSPSKYVQGAGEMKSWVNMLRSMVKSTCTDYRVGV